MIKIFLLAALMMPIIVKASVAELLMLKNFIESNDCSEFYYDIYNGRESLTAAQYSSSCAEYYYQTNVDEKNIEEVSKFFIDLAHMERYELLKDLYSRSVALYKLHELMRITRMICLAGIEYEEYKTIFR